MMVAWWKPLTRLYLVLWLLWVLFNLVGGPAFVAIQEQERARAAVVDYQAYAQLGDYYAAADAVRRMLEDNRTTLASLYQDMAHNWPDMLASLIGVPLAVYGVLCGTMLLLACVIQGCRRDRRRSPSTAPARTQPCASSSFSGGTAPKPPAWPNAYGYGPGNQPDAGRSDGASVRRSTVITGAHCRGQGRSAFRCADTRHRAPDGAAPRGRTSAEAGESQPHLSLTLAC